MKCPHCQTKIHGNPRTIGLGDDPDGRWAAVPYICPACTRIVVELVCAEEITGAGAGLHFSGVKKQFLGYPRTPRRPPAPPEVQSEFADDYREAALVLVDSPKASAALSRRCLQHILREKAGVQHAALAKEIEEVLVNGLLPSYLADAIDAIRNIGNLAAHPIKSTSSGEVVDVEPGEAEWNLDVLDGLFDFYFVQPAILKSRRAALNEKLNTAGKPPIK